MTETRTCPGFTRKACGATLDDGYLCQRCIDRTVANLDDLPGLARELETTICRQDRIGSGDGGSGKPGSRLPINIGALAKRNHEHIVIAYVCELGYRPDASTLASCAWTVKINPSRFATSVDGPAAARAIHRAVVEWRSSIDGGADKVYVAKCPDCDRPLYARPSRELVECSECGQEYDVQTSRQITIDALRTQLLPIRDIRKGLGSWLGVKVSDSTVRSWRRRGRLVARGKDRDGQETYRVGDFLDLADSLRSSGVE